MIRRCIECQKFIVTKDKERTKCVECKRKYKPVERKVRREGYRHMKKIILILLLLIPTQVEAYIFVEPLYTERVAEKTRDWGYTPNSTGGFMGGRSDSLGGAFQFKVLETMNIDWLSVDARGYNLDSSRLEQSNFDFKLYWGSKQYRDTNYYVPDLNTLAYKSTAYFKDNVTTDRYFDDKMVKFDQTLKPGTYWLAREDNGSARDLKVDQISPRFATVHNPEPTTMLMLAGGLLGAFRMRKKASYT